MTTLGKQVPLCPDWRVWALTGVVAAVDLVWVLASPHTLDWRFFTTPAIIAVACLGWYFAGYLVPLHELPRRVAVAIGFVAIFVPLTTLFGQLVMTLPFPLVDATLARWDQALGFDWPAYLSWVVARPWLSQVMLWTYYLFAPVALAAVFLLAILGQHKRVAELLTLAFIAAVIASAIGSAFPAFGAPTYHQARSLMASLPPQTGTQWIYHLTEVRSSTPTELSNAIGMISMPSYHVALTMIVAWSLRGVLLLFPLSALFAIVTAASAPIIGGHYFVDLIGGAALVCIMIIGGKIWQTFTSAAIPALRVANAPKSVPVGTSPE